jgi:hypothetical protein
MFMLPGLLLLCILWYLSVVATLATVYLQSASANALAGCVFCRRSGIQFDSTAFEALAAKSSQQSSQQQSPYVSSALTASSGLSPSSGVNSDGFKLVSPNSMQSMQSSQHGAGSMQDQSWSDRSSGSTGHEKSGE